MKKQYTLDFSSYKSLTIHDRINLKNSFMDTEFFGVYNSWSFLLELIKKGYVKKYQTQTP